MSEQYTGRFPTPTVGDAWAPSTPQSEEREWSKNNLRGVAAAGRLWPTPQGYARGKPTNSTPGLTPLDIKVRGLYQTAPPALNQLTLFAEAFPVSPTPWLASVPVAATTATSGPTSLDSFASVNLDGSWRKTSQGYSQVTLDGSLEVFSETWPRAGMTRSGIAYRRAPSAPLTDAIGSGSWPTPDARDSQPEGYEAGLRRREKYSTWGLQTAVMWPTPECLPTPTAHRWDGLQSHGVNVVSGSLNPTWVSVLMGYPPNWTEVE